MSRHADGTCLRRLCWASVDLTNRGRICGAHSGSPLVPAFAALATTCRHQSVACSHPPCLPCRGLRDILPALEQRQQAPAAESWDALLEVDDAAQLAAAVAGSGRLMQLQCVHWPNVPFRLAEHCKAACPKVALNPTAEEVARRRLPAACDPAVELDTPLLAGKGCWSGCGSACGCGLACGCLCHGRNGLLGTLIVLLACHRTCRPLP